jgi:hypothetical protein
MADEGMVYGRGSRLKYITPKQLQRLQELEEAREAKARRKSVRATRAAEAEQHRLALPYVRVRTSKKSRHRPASRVITRGRMYKPSGPFRYETSRSRNSRNPALVRAQLAALPVVYESEEEEEDLGLNMGGLSLGKGGARTVKNRRRR